MSPFEEIRPFYDTEVDQAIKEILMHPMLKEMMNFTFPNVSDEYWRDLMTHCHSIRDFQINFIYPGVQKVLEKSSEGLTTSGFENLEKNVSYLFISNHRDIILDTSLLNASLYEHGLAMTTSAIGDNLVKKPFLNSLSRLTRNFKIKRGLPARELLESSKLTSAYIKNSLLRENRSVWIAQREGRTKDGNDQTHKGVLKMISMASDEDNTIDYFKKLNIVPVSISYEYDPTDMLKMPELLAKARSESYIKGENEDFITLLSGIMGQKKRIHIHIGEVLNDKISEIGSMESNGNKQFQLIADLLDEHILKGFKLWPSNFIAHDLLTNTSTYQDKYTHEEKALFERRFQKGVDTSNPIAFKSYLDMYANPVLNKAKRN
ncbi:1-acyl-sn-glycerol-3-phosphate acyltransferase [Belliella kenyensis]|uniref:1-acyl-sn-glycerol-3-phosphate acyltransferase n=1 Tax=Belliella kenyensis TaxID=1472724 RepID=A0ABV8EGZ6_9BACT|nr:1-acyl-sn-glycerol-3-phosphate acyltransferase [Belliella kenyensis]MCH7401761.1 1-acyl-sn-glycerol-3-phosphate acyltransferase [Belliella kenyensis]MDN3604260.1 1-acyl-sn-glycerol-3-phosphate acyltransferase [Belliella kenyensis]